MRKNDTMRVSRRQILMLGTASQHQAVEPAPDHQESSKKPTKPHVINVARITLAIDSILSWLLLHVPNIMPPIQESASVLGVAWAHALVAGKRTALMTRWRLPALQVPVRPRWGRLLDIARYVIVAGILAVAVVGVAVYGYVARDLPPANDVFTTGMFQTAMIYDRSGRLLDEVVDPNGGQRSVVPLSAIPHVLIQATVMTEDASFYTNPGVDPLSILRAFGQDVIHRRIVSGASTITQQLVRNVIMTPAERQSKSIWRKVGEAILAFRVSQRYSKDEILDRYLNEIYYGNLAYGVEAASETYFGKPVQEIDLAQAALLAGLPQAPALYDPYQHPAAAKQRQREVLSLMVKHGAITAAEAKAAAAEPLVYRSLNAGQHAPHFDVKVRDYLDQRFTREQIYQKGLRVYTSLDVQLQSQIEHIVQQQYATLQADGADNAAVVVIDPRTGEILALVGSENFWDNAIQGQVDMASAPRPPGALLEPFTYLAAFNNHLAMPATVLADAPVQYSMGAGKPPYRPQDADGKFRGPVTVRQALAGSLNVPAIEMLDRVGVGNLLTELHHFGITTLDHPASYYGLSLTLGPNPVRLLDVTEAYAVLANGGVQVGEPVAGNSPEQSRFAPVSVLKVTDAHGKVLSDYQPPSGQRLVSPQAAWLMTDILDHHGAKSPLTLPNQSAAVKTGLSEGLRDSWVVGYTPQVVVGVWVGNTNGRPMGSATVTQETATIWHDAIEAALQGHPTEPFVRPSGLVRATVDATTGLLPLPGRPTVTDWFVQGTVPTVVAPTPTPLPRTLLPVVRDQPTVISHAPASHPGVAPHPVPPPSARAKPAKQKPGKNKRGH